MSRSNAEVAPPILHETTDAARFLFYDDSSQETGIPMDIWTVGKRIETHNHDLENRYVLTSKSVRFRKKMRKTLVYSESVVPRQYRWACLHAQMY